MNKSESITELAAAMSKAQATIKAAQMNSVNPFLKNRYADLGAVIEAAREPLSANGLSYTQTIGGDGNSVSLTTLLMHASGQWIESTVTLPFGEEKGRSLAQGMGSTVTYLRRYTLAAVLGIYADEDADGNQKEQKQAARAEEHKPATKPAAPTNGKGMDYDTACAFTNSDGVKYGEIDNETLAGMSIGIGKALAKNHLTDEQKALYLDKQEAIKVILTARAQQPA